MVATTPRAMRSASAEVRPDWGSGMEAMAVWTIRSTSALDSPS